MRGGAHHPALLLSPIAPDHRIPAGHPTHHRKPIPGLDLTERSPLFRTIYARASWPSIPPRGYVTLCGVSGASTGAAASASHASPATASPVW